MCTELICFRPFLASLLGKGGCSARDVLGCIPVFSSIVNSGAKIFSIECCLASGDRSEGG